MTIYQQLRPDGQPRPVIDLEPHCEATHHTSNVSLAYSARGPTTLLKYSLELQSPSGRFA